MGRPCAAIWICLRRPWNKIEWQMGSHRNHGGRPRIILPTKRPQLLYDQGTVNAVRTDRSAVRDGLSATLGDERNIGDQRRGCDRWISDAVPSRGGEFTGRTLRCQRLRSSALLERDF